MAVKWHILGAGAIGQLLACKLLRAGIPAQLLARDDASAQALKGGIEVLSEGQPQGQIFELSATTTDRLEGIRALIITTKANQAIAAFKQVAHLLQSGAPVVLLHNGMGVYEQLVQTYPPQHLFCGSTTAAAYRDGPSRLVLAGHGATSIGQYASETVPDWFASFAGNANSTESANGTEIFTWERDIAAILWRKLLINCAINPLTAIHRCRNGELLENPEYRAQATLICAEIAAVCRARGEAALANQVRDIAFDVMRSSAQNRSSMLQDVLNSRPTEIDYITGYLCREARRLGVPSPINERLWKQLS